MGKSKTPKISKAERKALEKRAAKIEQALAEKARRKAERKASKSAEVDLGVLKPKALRKLAADETLAKGLRKAAKRELEKRKGEPPAAVNPALTITVFGDDLALVSVEGLEATIADPTMKTKRREAAVAELERRAAADETPKAKVTKAAKASMKAAANPEAMEHAETALEAATEARDDETDEQIKARLKAKRDARAKLKADAEAVDRADEDAVQAHNVEVMATGGGTLLTSDAEKAKSSKRVKAEQVAEVVETPTGTIIAVGSADVEDDEQGPASPERDGTFIKPSEAPIEDFETNGRGQYQILDPETGKLVSYTRATTYIGNLEDTTQLEKWKLRTMLEGVTIHDTAGERGESVEPVLAEVSALMHRRDLAIAKARKADRKGKLEPGELATIIASAEADCKRALNDIVERMLEAGGANEKAQHGTDLHALFEVVDSMGLAHVEQLAEAGEVTPADLLDCRAYVAACEAAGLRFIPELTERPIVVDELKVAGRMDRGCYARPGGASRAVRVVADVKTGRVDYSQGKIAQQLAMYARGKGYDLDTHERTDLKLSQRWGVLIHVPAGTGTAFVHWVDLALGGKGIALSGQVRTWRNEGKAAYAVKAPAFAVDVKANA